MLLAARATFLLSVFFHLPATASGQNLPARRRLQDGESSALDDGISASYPLNVAGSAVEELPGCAELRRLFGVANDFLENARIEVGEDYGQRVVTSNKDYTVQEVNEETYQSVGRIVQSLPDHVEESAKDGLGTMLPPLMSAFELNGHYWVAALNRVHSTITTNVKVYDIGDFACGTTELSLNDDGAVIAVKEKFQGKGNIQVDGHDEQEEEATYKDDDSNGGEPVQVSREEFSRSEGNLHLSVLTKDKVMEQVLSDANFLARSQVTNYTMNVRVAKVDQCSENVAEIVCPVDTPDTDNQVVQAYQNTGKIAGFLAEDNNVQVYTLTFDVLQDTTELKCVDDHIKKVVTAQTYNMEVKKFVQENSKEDALTIPSNTCDDVNKDTPDDSQDDKVEGLGAARRLFLTSRKCLFPIFAPPQEFFPGQGWILAFVFPFSPSMMLFLVSAAMLGLAWHRYQPSQRRRKPDNKPLMPALPRVPSEEGGVELQPAGVDRRY